MRERLSMAEEKALAPLSPPGHQPGEDPTADAGEPAAQTPADEGPSHDEGEPGAAGGGPAQAGGTDKPDDRSEPEKREKRSKCAE